jgi:hypothetical protein
LIGSLYKEVEEFVNGYNIYLETRHKGFIPMNSSEVNDQKKEVVALIVTPAKNGIPAWETEVPAKKLVEEIKNKTEKTCTLLLSRYYKTFVGYYAQIK